MRHAFALFIAAWLLAACSAPRPAPDAPLVRGGVTLVAAGDRFERLQPIELTLANAGPVSYESNVVACAVAEEWSGRAWFRSDDDRRACIAATRRLSPGTTLDGRVRLDVPPGTYRLVHTVTTVVGGVVERVATRPFVIVARPR